MARHIRWQADACRQLGSPLYSGLLQRVAKDVLDDGPAAQVLAGHETDPGPSALALRLMGGVHRLVLDGRAPELAAFYPSAGGRGTARAAWPTLRAAFVEHSDELRSLLQQPPQTNEVGRSSSLIGGLLHVTDRWPGPLRLVEIGASAGLNLRADHFRLTYDGSVGVGPVESPVVLAEAWFGNLPPTGGDLTVVERVGCDTAPLDPTSEDGRLRLMSYVWPDQRVRFDRLRGALDIAALVPAVVHREPAGDFVRRLGLELDTTTVIWHSIMWQYLDEAERADVEAGIARLAAAATDRSRLAHLALEPRRRSPSSEREMLVTLQTWPGDEPRVLGVAAPHGMPTIWE